MRTPSGILGHQGHAVRSGYPHWSPAAHSRATSQWLRRGRGVEVLGLGRAFGGEDGQHRDNRLISLHALRSPDHVRVAGEALARPDGDLLVERCGLRLRAPGAHEEEGASFDGEDEAAGLDSHDVVERMDMTVRLEDPRWEGGAGDGQSVPGGKAGRTSAKDLDGKAHLWGCLRGGLLGLDDGQWAEQRDGEN